MGGVNEWKEGEGWMCMTTTNKYVVCMHNFLKE